MLSISYLTDSVFSLVCLCIFKLWSGYWERKKIANGIQGQGLRLSPIRIQDNPQSAVFKVTQDKGGIGRAQANF